MNAAILDGLDGLDGAAGWLATYLLHSTLLLLGAVAVTSRLRDPAARERLWKLALVAPLLTASVARWIPVDLRPVLDLSRQPAGAFGVAAIDAAPAEPAARPLNDGPSEDRSADAALGPSAAADASAAGPLTESARPHGGEASGPTWTAVVVALWILGGGVLALRYAVATRRLHRRLAGRGELRNGVPAALLAELCATRPEAGVPRLTQAVDLSTPVVLARNEICLPRRVAEELPERELAAILAHELAHIRRGDLLWLRLCAAFECLLFVQPLNRLARRRLFEAVELLCDDWAGERTGDRLELAQGLATVARWAKASPAPLPLPCLDGDRGPLLERVERLLAAPVAARRPALITAALAAVVVGLSCAGPAVQIEPGDEALDVDVGGPDVESLDLDALIVLSDQVTGEVGRRLLALPDDWRERYAEPLSCEGAKAVRLLDRGRYDLWPKREGGAYYSFATDDHDYNREPDLEYQDDMLHTGFYGGMAGHLLDVGAVPLASVSLEAPPAGLDSAAAQTYSVVTSFVSVDDNPASALSQLVRGAGASGRMVDAVPGHSYLLRVVAPGEHDHLVAFTLMEKSPESIVIVGRVLKSWPVADERETRPHFDWRDDAPTWVRQLDQPALLALQGRVVSLVEKRLYAIPAAAWEAWSPPASNADAGHARLLDRERYERVTRVRGGGAYFSFHTRSHSYNEEPDLRWSDGEFSSGFAGGNRGAVVDLGEVPLDSVTENLTEAQRSALGALQAKSFFEGDRARPVPAVLGHTYVVRAALEDEHDLLAAFRPVHQDDQGLTIAWRVLARYSD